MNYEDKRKALRKMFDEPGIVVCPGVFDAIGALAAQRAGFKMVGFGGNPIAGSILGKPDIGLLNMTEMVQRCDAISSAIDIPLWCDADEGYGGLNNVRRTVRAFEKAGAAGINLEDQVAPKRCGLMEGVRVVPVEDMVEKIKIAVKSRNDPNFMLMARTDAKHVVGMDEAVFRAKEYVKAGADIIMIDGCWSREDILRTTKSVDAHICVVLAETTHNPDDYMNIEEYESLGVKFLFYPLSLLFWTAKNSVRMFESLMKNRNMNEFLDEMYYPSEYQDLVGFQEESSIRNLLLD